jgi:hypothetical protein
LVESKGGVSCNRHLKLPCGIEPARQGGNVNEHAGAGLCRHLEPKPNSEDAQQPAQPTTIVEARRPDYANARRSPLPSVSEIDAALEKEHGATPYRET